MIQLAIQYMQLSRHLVSAEGGFSNRRNLAITFEVMMMLPLLVYVLFFIARGLKLQKRLKNIYQKCKSSLKLARRNEELDNYSSTLSVHEDLIEPVDYYGSIY